MSPEQHTAALQRLREFLEHRWTTTAMDAWSHSFVYLAGPIPFHCYAEINPDMRGLVFRAMLSQPVPQAHRRTMVDLCNAINYQLPMGCFALNTASGELRWKWGTYVGPAGPSDEQLRDVIESSAVFLDRYVLAVIAAWNGATLEAAESRIGEDPGIGTSEDCHYRGLPHPRSAAAG